MTPQRYTVTVQMGARDARTDMSAICNAFTDANDAVLRNGDLVVEYQPLVVKPTYTPEAEAYRKTRKHIEATLESHGHGSGSVRFYHASVSEVGDDDDLVLELTVGSGTPERHSFYGMRNVRFEGVEAIVWDEDRVEVREETSYDTLREFVDSDDDLMSFPPDEYQGNLFKFTERQKEKLAAHIEEHA